MYVDDTKVRIFIICADIFHRWVQMKFSVRMFSSDPFAVNHKIGFLMDDFHCG